MVRFVRRESFDIRTITYASEFVALGFCIVGVAVLLCGVSVAAVAISAALLWCEAVVFASLQTQIYQRVHLPPISISRPTIDMMYYTLSIFGVVLFFVAHQHDREKAAFAEQSRYEQSKIDVAQAKISELESRQQNIKVLPQAVRAAAQSALDEADQAHKFVCGCAYQPQGTPCGRPLDPPATDPVKRSLIVAAQASDLAACMAPTPQVEVLQRLIATEQDLTQLRRLVDTGTGALQIKVGGWDVSARDAAKLFTEPPFAAARLANDIAPLKREIADAEHARDKSRAEFSVPDDPRNYSFLSRFMLEGWPFVLLVGIALKLSQTSYFDVQRVAKDRKSLDA